MPTLQTQFLRFVYEKGEVRSEDLTKQFKKKIHATLDVMRQLVRRRLVIKKVHITKGTFGTGQERRVSFRIYEREKPRILKILREAYQDDKQQDSITPMFE